MLEQIYSALDRKKIKQLTDPRNVGLYIFCVVVLAITWSGVRTLQSNYELEKKISALKQQNRVIDLENENTQLKNNYYKTDEYLDLAARQDLGLAAPGEKVLLVPKSVALKYVDQSAGPSALKQTQPQSKAIRNLEAWRDFLLGRNVVR
ncbi:MAG TPA: septum formation initiator family protein [Candidatus Saccharimonadales bacterium]|nr:septum formation initiator family protein [Candidatus Saccharimonadales bacterium]